MTTALKMKKGEKPVKPAAAGPVPVVSTKPSAIANRALLVKVTIHRWKPRVTDDEISAKVAAQYSADTSAGHYRKRLFPRGTFEEASSLEHEIRREYWDRTLPWSDDRGRLLVNVGYLPFMAKMAELKNKFDAAWRKVLPDDAAYQAVKAQAKKAFGNLYDESLYPPYEQACQKFGIEVAVDKVPTGEDFRVDIGNKEMDRVRREIDDRAAETIQEAMKTVWGRLHEVVGKMVERLNKYKLDKDGKVENTFRDTLVTNIGKLLDLLPSLNVTQDANLIKFEQDIRASLLQHTATVLRDDEKIRKNVAVEAQKILDKMAGFLK